MLDNLTRDVFAEQLNTKFNIYFTPEYAFEAELIEVSDLKKRPRQEVFSLLFLLPPEAPPAPQFFRVEHAALGAFELFLSPIERAENGIIYEAVFNRLFKQSA